MDLSELDDEMLIGIIAAHKRIEEEAKAIAVPLRAELLKRQSATGEISISYNGWVSRLKREPFTPAWLKRQWGYSEADLPPECFTEKVSAVIDWGQVDKWLRVIHDHGLEPTQSLVFEREKTTK
ncbi:hypothetical protein [Methylopila sp. 73B]|uniref:hypothetical protein n=1 Tax=Methylopila sp. 73B TaxID=1120792 RepID=UPI0012DDDA4E|nr:hypothetical protein [Methylopila sp. 73B]